MAINSRYSGYAETRIKTIGYSIMNSKSFTLLFLSIVALACNPDKQTKVDQSDITFTTDDASKLFFKNVRQSYYDMEEMEAAKLNVFRYKKRDQSIDTPIIQLAIVDNWRFDEAYVLLEPNDYLNGESDFVVKWELSGESGKINYTQGNKSDQVAFADQLYERLQGGYKLSIQINGTWLSFLDSEKSREAFRITMFDYYRLVKRI